jgi:TnpA family transposase
MARRRLLTTDQWATFLALPNDERELVRHYTLGRDDLDIVVTKRAAHNRLGCAVLLCYLRHPGRAPDPDELPPQQLLAFLARQVGADPADYVDYRRRSQTQREQIGAIMARTGHRAFDRAAFRELSNWLVSIAQMNRDPIALAAALVDELRRRQILLPSAAVLEMVLHQARGRAESLVHRALTEALAPDGNQALETLLEPYDETPTAMLAWLRHAPQSPAARNLVAIVERLTALRNLGVDRSHRARIPEAAFGGWPPKAFG